MEKTNPIQYGTARGEGDLAQIIDLQKRNIPQAISQEELRDQGFVTVHHDMELLRAMNIPHPHVVARHQGRVIGYALVMLTQFRHDIPVLIPMFEIIDQIDYQGQSLAQTPYFVMGQICIDKPYRGSEVFQELYQTMKKHMAPHFPYVITEVAVRNPRSLRAHYKAGFQNIYEYSTDQEDWVILLWDWN